jgi:hypothetical protein
MKGISPHLLLQYQAGFVNEFVSENELQCAGIELR